MGGAPGARRGGVAVFSVALSLFSVSLSLFAVSLSLFAVALSLFTVSLSLSPVATSRAVPQAWPGGVQNSRTPTAAGPAR